MSEAQKAVDSIRNNLAKGFYTVYVSNQMGISFKSAERYASDEVGEFWLVLADIALKSMNEMFSDIYDDHLTEVKMVTDSEN